MNQGLPDTPEFGRNTYCLTPTRMSGFDHRRSRANDYSRAWKLGPSTGILGFSKLCAIFVLYLS